MNARRWIPALAACSFLVTACPPPEADTEATEQTAQGDVRVVEGERAPADYPDLALRILSPSDGETLEEGETSARLEVQGFQLGVPTPGLAERGLAFSEDGQHIHLIVDNRPYQAIYDLSEPVDLEDLEPGPHVLRAFPSRSWHESVKVPSAFAATTFFVEDTAGTAPADLDAPLLTYSRPKDSYEGADADSVMVDFYVSNVELEEGGHTVRLSVDGEPVYDMTRWVPHYILGLPAGTHRIRLQLLDPDGQPVPGPFNDTEREIEVTRSDDS